MAKPNLPNAGAEDTVFSNLGLTREDLGMDTEGSGNEDLEGSGNEDLDSGSGNEDLESGVSHTTQKAAPKKTQAAPSRLPSSAEVKPDAQGNLVTADGKIVARAGKEARLYQDLHKTRGQAQTLQGQVADVTTRLHKAVEIGQQLHRDLVAARQQVDSVKQFGLDQSEHLTALRLFKELRDNPQQALKNLLTRAATNGINTAELSGASGQFDPKALLDIVRQEIGAAVNPLKERTEAEKRQAQATAAQEQDKARVDAQVKSFFDANQEAVKYLPVFTKMVNQYPDMTLGEIWARIQLHNAQNPPARGAQNSQQRSLPSGRASPPNGGGNDMAPVTDSYEAIVRDAMKAAGVQ